MTPAARRAAAFVAACAATAAAFPLDAAVSQGFEAHRRPGLNPAAIAVTSAWMLGAFIWATTAFLAWRKRWKAALVVAATTAATLAAGSLIKVLAARKRPYQTLEDFVALTTADDKSFPSNHTNAAFAAAFVLSAFLPRLRWFFLAFACCIALSRLYVGVHYLSDVFGGLALAILASSVALHFAGPPEPKPE